MLEGRLCISFYLEVDLLDLKAGMKMIYQMCNIFSGDKPLRLCMLVPLQSPTEVVISFQRDIACNVTA